MSESRKKMLIGWGGRDVTPRGKVSLWGQHRVRVTDEVRDPLTTTALAVSSEDRGEMAIMLIDQDTGRVKGTFVPFFGTPTWTATGPAVLARRTGALLLPGALVRSGRSRYRLVLDAPIERARTGNDEYDDWETTRRASAALESLIRRFPDQWTWFHRRWRTRPPVGWTSPSPPAPDDSLTTLHDHADRRFGE